MSKLYDAIIRNEEAIALIGLGYVGLPIAHAFAKKASALSATI